LDKKGVQTRMHIVTIIIPAFQEEYVIQSVIESIKNVMISINVMYEIIVVDDGSSDSTSQKAKESGAKVFRHAYNIGNGAAIKTGIRNAQGDVLIFMDGDGQHDPNDIPRFLKEISEYGLIVGWRTKESDTAKYRDFANLIYNSLATYICGTKIMDLTSGFRAIRAPLAKQFVYLLPNTFSYPTTMTLATIKSGHSVKYIPIKVAKRVGRSKIKPLKDGIRFLLILSKITTLFSPMKVFLPISLMTIFLGIFWYLFTTIVYGPKLPQASVILIISGILFFLMGLISEQITQLRYDRGEIAYNQQINEFDDSNK
jgi:glycosyltransferase involved in cell wall biosynthesis